MNTQSLDFLGRPGASTTGENPSLFKTHVSRPFLAVMGTVAVLSAVYYAVIAAPMYESDTKFTIHTQTPATSSLLAGLVGAPTNVGDLVAVQDYVQSQEMAEAMDQQFHLRQAYSKPRIDFMHWLSGHASKETYLQFFQKMVVVSLDREASIVDIDVRSFDRDSATPMANAILAKTEGFVNGMTQSVRNDTLNGALQELNRAKADAQKINDTVAKFRGASAAVDPAVAGAQVQGSQAAMDSQIATIQASLASALTFNKPDSPTVKQIQASLDAVKAQEAKLKAQQSSGPSGTLPKQVTAYETLTALRTNQAATLAAAQAAYDAARVLAQQREKYVVRVVSPTTPDKPSLPQRFRDFLMVILFAIAGYSIISLTIAGVRDHQGV